MCVYIYINILTTSLSTCVTVKFAFPPLINIAFLIFSLSFGSLFSRNLLALFVLGFTIVRILIFHLPPTEIISPLLNNYDLPSFQFHVHFRKEKKNRITHTYFTIQTLKNSPPDKISSTYKASNHLLVDKDTQYFLSQTKRDLVHPQPNKNAVCCIFHVAYYFWLTSNSTANRWGNSGTMADFILGGSKNHCRLVTEAMKLKGSYYLEGKIWPT